MGELELSVRFLGDLDGSLRCQICKEYFDTPVITGCSHTFCSLCIRKCLVHDERCPVCRTECQLSQLRGNLSIFETLEAFLSVRERLQQLLVKHYEERSEVKLSLINDEHEHGIELKRRLDSDPVDENKRSSKRRWKSVEELSRGQTSGTSVNDSLFCDEIDDHPDPYKNGREAQDGSSIVPCPVCGIKMMESAVFSHLDTCTDATDNDSKSTSQPKSGNGCNWVLGGQRKRNTEKGACKATPIAQLNYSLLSESGLRKKMHDLGIPSWGSKSLLIRRHTEWMNLFNANCDSVRPRSRRELLQLLTEWEKTVGGGGSRKLGSSTQSGMNETSKTKIDSKLWLEANRSHYEQLVKLARREYREEVPESGPASSDIMSKDDMTKQSQPAGHTSSSSLSVSITLTKSPVSMSSHGV